MTRFGDDDAVGPHEANALVEHDLHLARIGAEAPRQLLGALRWLHLPEVPKLSLRLGDCLLGYGHDVAIFELCTRRYHQLGQVGALLHLRQAGDRPELLQGWPPSRDARPWLPLQPSWSRPAHPFPRRAWQDRHSASPARGARRRRVPGPAGSWRLRNSLRGRLQASLPALPEPG